ncbi:MAG: tetratricopeptide repeat protein [Spirochaetes bacterium]|nr:tetratricopeptide repeat protein [Spirochaetota bacterium]
MKFKNIIIILLFLLITDKAYPGYYEDGIKYFSSKNYEKAKEMFLKSTEASDNGNSYYFLGEIEKNEGNFDKAEEYYKLSVNKIIIAKYRKLAYWNLIVIEEQKGKYNEMVIACRELWDAMKDEGAKKKVESLINKFLWTDNDEAKLLYNNGLDYKKKNVQDKAKEAFYEALRIDSYFLAPKFEIGLILFNENSTSQAISYFNDIIEKIPFYGDVHLLLGDIYFKNQSYGNSIEHLEKAIDYGFLDSKTKYSVMLKTGTSYYESGYPDKAQEKYLIASDMNKKAIEPLLMLSAIYIKGNNFDQAIPVLLKARELNKNNPEILFQLGSLYYKTDDFKYVQYFNLLFNKYYSSKESVPQKYLKAFTLLLKNFYDNKKYEEANKIFEFLPESQKTYDIDLISARSYHYTGKHEKAIEYFEKLSLNNDDKFLLCISYAKTGIVSKSKDILAGLLDQNGFLEKARSENAIKMIAAEIENEKLKKEEELKKAAEEEKRLFEEQKLKEETLKDEKPDIMQERSENGKEEDVILDSTADN